MNTLARISALISPALLAIALTPLLLLSAARGDKFGHGPHAFSIEFVAIGDPGNQADVSGFPNPAGRVDYAYRIGKYEISIDQVRKVAALGGPGITFFDWGYNDQWPAIDVNWLEAASFVNWLNTQTNSPPAYKFDARRDFQLWQPGDPGFDPGNPYRNRLARYFLPSVDEWYKAAYYDPAADVYYDYPTGSDAFPDGLDRVNDPTFDALFYEGYESRYPHEVTNVGKLSPYGTAGQGGSVFEWEETAADLVNSAPLERRGVRGGEFSQSGVLLASTMRFGAPVFEGIGFRVASRAVPEPSAATLALLAAAGGRRLVGGRRRAST
ncbi:MAG: hypothetical protein C0485_16820 [Pirellula sp.]|nr:hypothetical protein [Pirellula sp.]